jgi:hypothetical protein
MLLVPDKFTSPKDKEFCDFIAQNHAAFKQKPASIIEYLDRYFKGVLGIPDPSEHLAAALTLIDIIESSAELSEKQKEIEIFISDLVTLTKVGEPAAYEIWGITHHVYTKLCKMEKEDSPPFPPESVPAVAQKALAMGYTDHFFWGDRRFDL